MKSRTSRFFSSFNDHIKVQLEETVVTITELIDEMDKEAGLGGLAMQRKTLEDVHVLKANVEEDIHKLKDGLMDIHGMLLIERQEAYRKAQDAPTGDSKSVLEQLLQSFDRMAEAGNRVEDRFGKCEIRGKFLIVTDPLQIIWKDGSTLSYKR